MSLLDPHAIPDPTSLTPTLSLTPLRSLLGTHMAGSGYGLLWGGGGGSPVPGEKGDDTS